MASSTDPRERPMSVATVRSEAPPPYSEYDEVYPPPPNAQTQAMLRGGYIARLPQNSAPSVGEYGPAAAYMRGRPYSSRHGNTITIARAIHPGIKIDGVPFPSEYPAVSTRDVSADDWSYFVNCIMRELDVPNVKGAIATPVTMSEFRERQQMVDATIDQWNRGFFAPRGIHVVPAYSFQRIPAATESERSASPAPTYTTERTMGQDDEIMTITIDTSPRSTRAGTPETIRELNGEDTPPGALTPKTVDEEGSIALEPPRNPPRANSIPRKPLLPKRPSQDAKEAELSPNQLGYLPQHFEKKRRDSSASDSSDSSLSSMGSLSSDDALAEADLPAMRRSLAEAFRQDPKNWSHLKGALSEARKEILQQHKDMAAAPKQQRAEMKAAIKARRKEQRGEMKELRKELRGYYSIARSSKREEQHERRAGRKERKDLRREAKRNGKALKKDMKNEAKQMRRELKTARHHGAPETQSSPQDQTFPHAQQPMFDRRAHHPHHPHHPHHHAHHAPRGHTGGLGGNWPLGPRPANWPLGNLPPGWPLGNKPPGWPLGNRAPGWPLESKPPGWPLNERNMSMPQLGVETAEEVPVSHEAANTSPTGQGPFGRGVPRAMSSVSFDSSGSNLNPMCRRSCSPLRPGSSEEHVVNNCPTATFRDRFGRRQGPIGMAKDFLMAQANASLERLRMDGPNPGPAMRAGDESEWARSPSGQETGVVKK